MLLALGLVTGCQVPTAAPHATASAAPVAAAAVAPSLPSFALPPPTTTVPAALPTPTTTPSRTSAPAGSRSASALAGAPTRSRAASSPAGRGSGDTYTNVDGNRVQRPTSAASAPSGASARCQDGTYSFSQHRSGTCSGHGGVAAFL